MGKKSEYIGEYINNNEKYYVYANVDDLWNLVNAIVENLAYREEGNFCLTDTNSVKKALEDIEYEEKYFHHTIPNFSACWNDLPNNSPLYEDITSWDVTGMGFKKAIYFTGKKVVAPKIASIIRKMIEYGSEESIKDFFAYENDEETIPIDDKIDEINKRIAGVKSSNYDDETTKQLAKLYHAKATKQYFDTDLLNYYYRLARGIVEIKELNLSDQETETYNESCAKSKTI